jgi:hypothetical protein
MMKVIRKPTVLMERFPYRYVQVGTLEINGKPDYRIQKVDSYTGRYRDMYLCDNEMQLMTAMEDFDYTCWLDPDRVPCYVRDDDE